VLELHIVHVRLATLGDVRLNVARPCEQTADFVVVAALVGGGARAGGQVLLREGTPVAVTTMRSAAPLSDRLATGVALWRAGDRSRLGNRGPLRGGFRGDGAFAGTGFAGDLAATD
jgi:hypothetical protein